jgi:hypothetical protein
VKHVHIAVETFFYLVKRECHVAEKKVALATDYIHASDHNSSLSIPFLRRKAFSPERRVTTTTITIVIVMIIILCPLICTMKDYDESVIIMHGRRRWAPRVTR